MNFENPFIKKQQKNIRKEQMLGEHALEKFQITESEQFEIDNALYRKKQESLENFSQKDREDIQEYFAINNQIELMTKEILNKIERNLDNGTYTIKLSRLDELEKKKMQLEEHFKINPHLSDYIMSFNQVNPLLN